MAPFRVGIGYDSHALVVGRRLVLGGVQIPHDRGLAGHSDADVVLHAVADAILGASGLPDLGEIFPDTDPAYRDIDSRKLLIDVMSRAGKRGYTIGNVDLIVHADKPKLSGHKAAIVESIAGLVNAPLECVSVKAKTMEGFQAADVIACTAVVLLQIGNVEQS